jgi:hypothetical protein
VLTGAVLSCINYIGFLRAGAVFRFETPAPGRHKGIQDIIVSSLTIFVIRAILGAAIAVFLGRVFYPEADTPYVIGLAVILVGLAYFAEYLRNRKKR